MPFLSDLETKAGERVDQKSLKGKIVVLYFSSAWCPACVSFTPLLGVLHEEAKEEDKEFEVVYVSSDNDIQQFTEYTGKKHGDWLRVPYDSPLRNQLKIKYGVFAGKEQSQFVSTKRRSGISTLVVISENGSENAMLDCDSHVVVREVESKGVAFLDQWKKFRW